MIRDFTPELQRAIDDLKYEMDHGQHADDIERCVGVLFVELKRFRDRLKRQE